MITSLFVASTARVTSVATNVSTNTVTSSAGTYTVTDLIPGTYTVKVEKSGFSTGVLTTVHVDVSRTTSADVLLKTGAATETVEVVAQEIALETTQPQLGTVVENKLVDEVPILIGGGPGNIGARDRQIDDRQFTDRQRTSPLLHQPDDRRPEADNQP